MFNKPCFILSNKIKCCIKKIGPLYCLNNLILSKCVLNCSMINLNYSLFIFLIKAFLLFIRENYILIVKEQSKKFDIILRNKYI